MNKTYLNEFTGLIRWFLNKEESFASSDNGVTWSKNKIPLSLIERLPYYKEIKK